MAINYQIFPKPPVPLAERLWKGHVINPDNFCWEWQGALDRDGYGHMKVNGNRVSSPVHRVSYEFYIRKIPDGFVIDHLCNNPCCINPFHLNPTTQAANVLRSKTNFTAVNKRKTHCLRGHELSADNVYQPRNTNKRYCKSCMNFRYRRACKKKNRSLKVGE